MASALKEFSATIFGYVIAYLLPGLIGVYALSLWYEPLNVVFNAFVTSQSTTSIFLFVMLAALFLGVELMAFRWVIFDLIFCRKMQLGADEFQRLSAPNMIPAFQVAVDQHYRYHQFWGALVFVFPILFFGIAREPGVSIVSWEGFVGIIVEVVTFFAARNAYCRYVARARVILKGGDSDGERNRGEAKEICQEAGQEVSKKDGGQDGKKEDG